MPDVVFGNTVIRKFRHSPIPVVTSEVAYDRFERACYARAYALDAVGAADSDEVLERIAFRVLRDLIAVPVPPLDGLDDIDVVAPTGCVLVSGPFNLLQRVRGVPPRDVAVRDLQRLEPPLFLLLCTL